MKRFGTIFPFLEAGRQPRHIGRLVANHDFAQAILRYGDFDEFVFSNPTPSNLNVFADVVRTWGLSERRLSQVRFVPLPNLAGVLEADAFHVFHLGGWGWFMPGLHFLRARHASNPWPITAVTHSLNGRDVIDNAVRVSHAQFAPYDAIFCTSRDGREALRRLLEGGAAIAGHAFAGHLEHLPLGIDDDLFETSGDRARGRARLKIDPDAVVLLVLGRITPFQKMDLGPVLRTLAHDILPRAGRTVCLLLAGSATADDLRLVKADVDRYDLASHVRVHPNFPVDQKADVLATADVLVSPVDNAQETFGLSLIEGMAAGLPVVASRFDGYKDLIDDGVDGFLIDTYWSALDPVEELFDLLDRDAAQLFQSQSVAIDLPQLADRVLRLVQDPSLRASMGAAGRAKAAREYKWSRVVARYEACWNVLADQARTTGLVSAGEHLYNLGAGRIFSHYASHRVHRDERLVAVGEGLDVRPYNETAVLLDHELLSRVHSKAANGATVTQLLEAAQAPEAQAWFAVQWLLKYGMLRRA
ncbi:MAG TPA: glycosyltransferase family 4 protein [Vicinamibacterales bacterium]|jgi:glycosyltransferase involved in cell wall biosynthesis